MDVLHDRVAGLDIHKAMVMACVRSPGNGRTRTESEEFLAQASIMQLQPFDSPTTAAFPGVDASSPVQRQEAVLEARAACGGYPVLLERWDVTSPASMNLQRLGASPLDPLVSMSSVLLLDLPDTRGVQSVLTAIDPFRQLFEASQGDSVLAGSEPRWKALVQATFERDVRDHAVRIVRSGELPPGTLIGEWWSDTPQGQLDVVGIDAQSGEWRIVGEAKWVNRFGISELSKFERNLAIAGPRASRAKRMLWLRSSTLLSTDDSELSVRTLVDLF